MARRLSLTRGGVNGIITGDAVPSPTLMELLRLVVARSHPEVAERFNLYEEDPTDYTPDKIRDGPGPVPEWMMPVMTALGQVNEASRAQAVKAVEGVLAAFPKGGSYRKSKGSK